MGCLFNCFAEQFGNVDCPVEACNSCGCENDPAQDDENEAPCGLCDFIFTGGVPTISPITLGNFDVEVASLPAWFVAANQANPEREATRDVIIARGSYLDDGALAEPCEMLARGTAPVRGPTTV